jgi:Arc/MetJ family transcription regulator
MRTNMEIDDELMRRAMAASGKPTKKATVEAALELLVKVKGQERIREAFGKLPWDGDLDAMRLDRPEQRPTTIARCGRSASARARRSTS